jgi:hypothetical protein
VEFSFEIPILPKVFPFQVSAFLILTLDSFLSRKFLICVKILNIYVCLCLNSGARIIIMILKARQKAAGKEGDEAIRPTSG